MKITIQLKRSQQKVMHKASKASGLTPAEIVKAAAVSKCREYECRGQVAFGYPLR